MQRQRHQPAVAEQGPLDWLVPFIPPFLRVNRETRAALVASLQSLSLPALGGQLAAFLQTHGSQLFRLGVVGGVWLYALAWTDRAAPEFTATYVILSGLGALLLHLFSGDRAAASGDGISAYSVFNKGGARMLGSLSAEQFENEIRHRLPDHGDADGDRNGGAAFHDSDHDEDEEANDPDLLLAMQLSLQEKKREERRARRTTKRR